MHQDEGVVKLDEGQIDSAKVNLAYCKIAAPVTGRIGLRLVDPGNIVQAADTNGLVVITQMDPISAIFTISEDQLQVVLKKMAAGQTLEVDAYDRADKTKLAQGSLTTLDNQIDPTTGTLKLRATFENAKGTLFPNQFVNARLLVQEKRGVTLVPTAAVQRNSQATYVYVVKADSTVTVRTITIGTTEGDDSEVTAGLAPGEVVVMTGVDKLQEGTKVNAQIPSARHPQPSVSPSAEQRPDPKGKLDEPVPDFHSPAGGHHDADGGHPAGGRGRVHAATGFGVAGGGLSDHSGHYVLSRRQPGRDGVFGDRAARTSVRTGARTPADDFHQFRRKLGDHAAIQPQPEYRRGRAGSAAIDQRLGYVPAGGPADASRSTARPIQPTRRS